MPKNKTKEKSINRSKTIVELVICAVFIGTSVYLAKSCFDRSETVPSVESHVTIVEDVTVPEETEAVDPNKIIFGTYNFPTKSKFYGDLILVNNDHQYFSTGEEDLVSILSMNDDTNRSFFTAVNYDYTILRPVYEPMAAMIGDFYERTYNDTLIIYGSYRSTDFQQQLYDQFTQNTAGDGEAPIVAPPGFSEHETGYAFDFSETVNYDYQGTDEFAWINENCYKYGFVVRYPADKEDITEYRSEPWHFRYVGIPHATYMTKNNLCLEEYIDLLREKYTYSDEHLQITDDSGKNYEVYFFPSEDGEEFTAVPVPSGVKYDISGNNVDGFIVTVHKDEKVAIGEENPIMKPTEPPTEAPSEDETEETTEDETEAEDENSAY